MGENEALYVNFTNTDEKDDNEWLCFKHAVRAIIDGKNVEAMCSSHPWWYVGCPVCKEEKEHRW
jgi:hypothetical protein